MKKKYYIDKTILYCYPYGTNKKVTNYGVLGKYIDKEYNRKQIDKIIAEMIIKHPYINNSMSLTIYVGYRYIENGRNIKGTYHNLYFINDNYKKQERNEESGIKYEITE